MLAINGMLPSSFSVCVTLALLLLSCGFLGNCERSGGKEPVIAIQVGSRKVNLEELKKDIEYLTKGMEISRIEGKGVKSRLLEELIDRYLVLEYGKEKGIRLSEQEFEKRFEDLKQGYTKDSFEKALLEGYVNLEEWKARLREQFLIDKIIEHATKRIHPPDYQEIKAYFEEHRDQFETPPMVKFRQIVTRKRAEAEEALRRLKSGEDMGEVAREVSTGPEAENGGVVGWVAEGRLEESMEKPLFSLSEGKISGVVESPYGYHIFQVLSVRPEGGKRLPEVMGQVEEDLLAQRRKAFLDEWVEELRSQYQVDINREILKGEQLI